LHDNHETYCRICIFMHSMHVMHMHYMQFCIIINTQLVSFFTETQFYCITVKCIWYFLWMLCIMHEKNNVWYAFCIICTKHILLCILHWNIILQVTFIAFYTLWNSLTQTDGPTERRTDGPTDRHCHV
jgi:hypothetical protein